jgi:hypothetical protein
MEEHDRGEETADHDDERAEDQHGRPTRVVAVDGDRHELGDRRPGRSQQHRRHCTMRAGRDRRRRAVENTRTL